MSRGADEGDYCYYAEEKSFQMDMRRIKRKVEIIGREYMICVEEAYRRKECREVVKMLEDESFPLKQEYRDMKKLYLGLKAKVCKEDWKGQFQIQVPLNDYRRGLCSPAVFLIFFCRMVFRIRRRGSGCLASSLGVRLMMEQMLSTEVSLAAFYDEFVMDMTYDKMGGQVLHGSYRRSLETAWTMFSTNFWTVGFYTLPFLVCAGALHR